MPCAIWPIRLWNAPCAADQAGVGARVELRVGQRVQEDLEAVVAERLGAGLGHRQELLGGDEVAVDVGRVEVVEERLDRLLLVAVVLERHQVVGDAQRDRRAVLGRDRSELVVEVGVLRGDLVRPSAAAPR